MRMHIRNVRTYGNHHNYIYIAWLIIEHPRERLASLADNEPKNVIGKRAKRVRHPLLLPIKMFGRKYVKTAMRMLTILREAEEWTRVHLREACLQFASAITKSSLYVYVKTTKRVHIK